MSLVVAVRLQNHGILFASDKQVRASNAEGETLSHHAGALKLREYGGGVLAFVGDSDVRALVQELKEPSEGADARLEIRNELDGLFQRHTRHLDERATRDKRAADIRDHIYGSSQFLFGVLDQQGIGQIVRFFPDDLFTPHPESDDVAPLGMIDHAERLRHFLKKDDYSLQDAQRLASVLISATHDACPGDVSAEMDMWLLERSGVHKYPADEIAAIRSHAENFLARMKSDLYR